jgi:hypothetical protein
MKASWQAELWLLIRKYGLHDVRNAAMQAGWRSENLPKKDTPGWKGEK